MSSSKKKKKNVVKSSFTLPIICLVVGCIMLLVGIVNIISAYSEKKTAETSEHITGEVVRLKIVDSYIRAVVEYPAKDGTAETTFERSDLYQGEKLSLYTHNGKLMIYDDGDFLSDGTTKFGFIFGYIGLLISAISLAVIIKIKKTGSGFFAGHLFMFPFFTVGTCFLLFMTLSLASASLHPSAPDENVYDRTAAVLVNVPEYEVKRESYTDADGDRQYKYVTYYYGDTVARYEVDDTEYLAKVGNAESHYEGQEITVNYCVSSPGMLRGSNYDSRGTAALVYGIIGGVFTFVSLVFILIFWAVNRLPSSAEPDRKNKYFPKE